MSYQSAGFVDLQVNGYQGLDFGELNNTAQEIRSACNAVLARGTSAFLPTVITAPLAVYEQTLPRLAGIISEPAYQGRLLGLHLEGPFLSNKPGAIGAHNPVYCQGANLSVLDRLHELSQGQIRLLTIAADIPDADILCRHAISLGITVSLGHSLAQCDELQRLSQAGAQALTHLGNGIPNQIDRHHNPLWSGLANDDLSAMIITDGHHLPVTLQKVIIRSKSIDKIIVVSDASPIAGMPPGNYDTLGNKVILESNGKLHNPEKKCLVGSSAMMIDCMNQLAQLHLLDHKQLLQVGRSNALALIHVDDASVANEHCLQFNPYSAEFTILS